MKLRITALALALLMLLCLVGCQSAAQATPTPVPTVAPTPVSTPEPTPTPAPASLTTGLPGENEYKPVVMMIENSSAARPQTGLNTADIVYEAPVESGVTRFMCVFNDTIPEVAGPCRSTRIYFINLLHEWDTAPFIHFGGPSTKSKPSDVYAASADFIKVRIDGVKGYDKYFYRSTERKAPHNAYCYMTKVVADKYDYTPAVNTSFAFDANALYESAPLVSSVTLPFYTSDSDNVRFVYDAESGKFLRFTGSKEFTSRDVDAATNEQTTAQVSVKNIIVQHTNVYLFDNDIKGRRNCDVVGSGKADFFVNGRHLTGAWSRASADANTVWTLDDGAPLVLQPGNTWVEIHPDSKTIKVEETAAPAPTTEPATSAAA